MKNAKALLLIATLIAGCLLPVMANSSEDTIPSKADDAGGLPPFEPVGALEPVVFVRVVDGDTVEVLRDGEDDPRIVRLFAVDCPELDSGEPQAFEAALYLSGLLDGNAVVYLEIDEAHPEDQYGRLLAWLWVEPPGGRLQFVQALLMQQRYAAYYPKVQSDWHPMLAEVLPQPGDPGPRAVPLQPEEPVADGESEVFKGHYDSVSSATSLNVRVDGQLITAGLAGLSLRPQYEGSRSPDWLRVVDVQRWIDDVLSSRPVRMESVPGKTDDGKYLVWFSDNNGEFLLQAQLPLLGISNIYSVDEWLDELIAGQAVHPLAETNREELKQAQAEEEERRWAEHQAQYHQIELVDHGLKWTRNTGSYNYYSWRVKLRNNTQRKIWVNCKIELIDGDDFVLHEAYIWRKLLPPGETTFRQESLVENYLARQVVRYQVYAEECPY